MKLTIIGTGYVGLVTGACFAEVGHQVVCVDNDAAKVKMLQGGGIPIYEPGLEELVRSNAAAGRLSFTTSTAEGVDKSDVIFIAVPTPPLPDGSVDMSFIEKVAREIAGAMTSYKIVVDKSTVPVKTGDKVAETIKRYCKARVEFDVVSNPEFLREGFAVEDLMRPDRIVIGVRSQRPVRRDEGDLRPVQGPDYRHGHQLRGVDQARLQFLPRPENLLHQRHLGHVRGHRRQRPGSGQRHGHGRPHRPAVSGRLAGLRRKLFSQGPERLHQDRRAGRLRFRLLKEVQRINAGQMNRFVKKIIDTLWVLKDKTIGVLGLAFKQNTDDIRMSPAIELCQRLQKEGARLRVHDPKAMEKARAVLKDVTFVEDMNEVAEGCDALVIATEWDEFKKLDLDRARKALTHPIMFDGRNLFDPAEMERLGFIYKSIGR